MRAITDHVVEGDSANHQLTIQVTDQPGAGGANHRYEITGFDAFNNPSNDHDDPDVVGGPTKLTVMFQNGTIKDVGVNGVTQEALLAIVIDRLKSFQEGPFASNYNGVALEASQRALHALQGRTRDRIARKVEGTHQQ